MNISGINTTRRYGGNSEEIVLRLRKMIQCGDLNPGDRLPSERKLAELFGVSRPTLRNGIRSLSQFGLLRSHRGSGTFLVEVDKSPTLESNPLRLMASLQNLTAGEMFETRIVLEMCVAGLAAERSTAEQIILMAEEIVGMFASIKEPEQFTVHNLQFHKTIAAASNNRILAALMNMVTQILFDERSKIPNRVENLKESAEMHRRIYLAIRAHDAEIARERMREYLLKTEKGQQTELL